MLLLDQKLLCMQCVTVLHNIVELDSSMTKQNHTFSCSPSICRLWFILGNLLNSREEKGILTEEFTAMYGLSICTFSFAWNVGVGALKEFHEDTCKSSNSFEALFQSHSLCLRECQRMWQSKGCAYPKQRLCLPKSIVRNVLPYRREKWTGECSLAWLPTLTE